MRVSISSLFIPRRSGLQNFFDFSKIAGLNFSIEKNPNCPTDCTEDDASIGLEKRRSTGVSSRTPGDSPSDRSPCNDHTQCFDRSRFSFPHTMLPTSSIVEGKRPLVRRCVRT